MELSEPVVTLSWEFGLNPQSDIKPPRAPPSDSQDKPTYAEPAGLGPRLGSPENKTEFGSSDVPPIQQTQEILARLEALESQARFQHQDLEEETIVIPQQHQSHTSHPESESKQQDGQGVQFFSQIAEEVIISHSEEISGMQQQIDTVSSNLPRVDALEVEMEKLFEGNENKPHLQNGDTDAENGRFAELQARIEGLEQDSTRISDLEQFVDILLNDKDKNDQIITELQEKVGTLEQSVETLLNERERVDSIVDQMKFLIEETQKVPVLQETIAQLTEQTQNVPVMEETIAQLTEKTQQIPALEEKIEQLKAAPPAAGVGAAAAAAAEATDDDLENKQDDDVALLAQCVGELAEENQKLTTRIAALEARRKPKVFGLPPQPTAAVAKKGWVGKQYDACDMCDCETFMKHPFKDSCKDCFHPHPEIYNVGQVKAKSTPMPMPEPEPEPEIEEEVAETPPCEECGCTDFRLDPFRGRCAECFHKHPNQDGGVSASPKKPRGGFQLPGMGMKLPGM